MNGDTKKKRWPIVLAIVVVLGSAAGTAAWVLAPTKHEVDVGLCDEGDAHGCVRVASDFEYGRGVAADPVKARAYYERTYSRAADAPLRASGAETLARFLANGRGGPTDLPRALRLYDEKCRWDVADGAPANASDACYQASRLRERLSTGGAGP